jgi:hypothetical protein
MNEPTTIGLTKEGHDKLQRLKEDGYFAEMADAYRFAIALALAHGITGGSTASRGTIFNVGTLDPDRSLYFAVKTLVEPRDEPVYKVAEKLAEWGVEELYRTAQSGHLSFAKLLEESESLLTGQ